MPELTVRIVHSLAPGDPTLTDSIGESLRNLEAAGIVRDFSFEHASEIYVGKTGEGESLQVGSMKDAEAWIERQRESDPEGVERGDYYIDA